MARRERGRRSRKKVCNFCVDKVDHIDYKDSNRLKKYMTERGKILPRRITGNCAKHPPTKVKTSTFIIPALRPL